MWYPNPIFQAFDDNGNPLNGGKLYTYINQTTTPKTTYTDYDLQTANTNPIILDSRGECGPIFGFGYFKFLLKDENNVQIWVADNIWGIGCCSQTLVFDDDDLDESGNMTVTHDYGQKHLRVDVFNDSGIKVEIGNIDCSSTTQIVLNFGLVTLIGTWTVRYGL